MVLALAKLPVADPGRDTDLRGVIMGICCVPPKAICVVPLKGMGAVV
jgi:hypothetical protein